MLCDSLSAHVVNPRRVNDPERRKLGTCQGRSRFVVFDGQALHLQLIRMWGPRRRGGSGILHKIEIRILFFN
jgi:hypothetical protein